MQIISSAGIEPEDIPALLASHGLDPRMQDSEDSAKTPSSAGIKMPELTRR